MTTGLERTTTLSGDSLAGIAALEAATVGHDGGRLKLEWNVLEHRSGDVVSDLLWWRDNQLVGFAGIYAFGTQTVEVTGMVHPEHRRQGVGAALLDGVFACCRERGVTRFLLVTPRSPEFAKRLALSRGATYHHSEHALALTRRVEDGPQDDAIVLRRATSADNVDVDRILTAAFGHAPPPLDVDTEDEPTLVADRAGHVIASLRVHKGPASWGVYGFGVEPPSQGRGIGRDLLRRVCKAANEAGVGRVHLEVSVDNDRALGLYTSLGFVHEATEDYYELLVP